MKPLNQEELQALKSQYGLAAAIQVAEEGWSSLSVRNVGAKVGKSGTAIQRLFPGNTLKFEVIERAFDEIAYALEPLEAGVAQQATQLHQLIITHLRDEPDAVALMVQVAALQAASKSADASQVHVAIARGRARIVHHIANLLRKPFPGLHRDALERRAESIVEWYAVACMTVVMSPLVSDAQLLALARPWPAYP